MECKSVEEEFSKPDNGVRRSRSSIPKSLYLLYNHFPYPAFSCSNSFYKIDIPSPKDSNSGELTREVKVEGKRLLLSPMLEMEVNSKLYTKGMKCARLGSKVYFLGGQNFKMPPTDSESDLDLETARSLLFPPDVYVMDLAKARGDNKEIEILQKLDAQLNCGKPDPCVFAAQGKLYALGSAILMHISIPGLSSSMSGKMFERYDPSVGKWEVLDDPPIEGLHWRNGFTVILNSHGLVLFEGRLLYDLRRDKWVTISPDLFTLSVAAIQPRSYGYALYGINGFGSPMKMLLQVQEQDQKECAIQMRLIGGCGGSKYNHIQLNCDKETHSLVGDRYIDSVIQMHSLDDGYFCHVVVGDLPHPKGRDEYGYLPSDPCSRAVKVTVFKEIIQDHVTHSPITEGESSFQVEVLYSQEYVIRTTSCSKGNLVSSFVLSQDQEGKLKKKVKRSMKKNNQKIADSP